MNTDSERQREIDALIHEVTPSEVPLVKPDVPIQTDPILIQAGFDLWAKQSLELVNDYKMGCNLGKFGDNKSPYNVLPRLGEALKEIVTQQFLKESKSSEKLKHHFQILQCSLQLISSDLLERTEDFSPTSLIAALNGFLNTYSEHMAQKR